MGRPPRPCVAATKRLNGMRVTVLAAVLLVLQAAQATPQTIRVYVFGTGQASCATWLSNPSMEQRGIDWLLGAWSGLNFMNEKHHLVGSHTDELGIIGEVKAFCTAHPSEILYSAVAQTYVRLETAGR